MDLTYTVPEALADAVSAQFASRTPRDLGDPSADPPRAAETAAAHVQRAVTEWLDAEIGAARKRAAADAVKAATDDTALSAALLAQHKLTAP